jgi:hypothetical protein
VPEENKGWYYLSLEWAEDEFLGIFGVGEVESGPVH